MSADFATFVSDQNELVMKKIIRIIALALLLMLPLGVSAQGTITGPKKKTPKKEQHAPAKKPKSKTSASSSPAASTYRKGEDAYRRQDYTEAFRLYSEAAEQGNIDAIYQIAGMYYMGRGVAQNYGEAARWYRKGCDKGDSNSMFRLGIMYEEGQGVPQDYDEAARWYEKSAAKGNPTARHRLNDLKKKRK